MQAGGCELYLIKMKRLDQFNEGKSPADCLLRKVKLIILCRKC